MYTNLDVKLRIGGRKAPVISKEEFIKKLRKKVSKELPEDYDESSPLSTYLVFEAIYTLGGKDLKVDFDTENLGVICNGGMNFEEEDIESCIISVKGIPVLPLCAGGDWEIPLCFFIYYDGKKLRAYIPTYGNTYNTKTMSAFGNSEEDYELVRYICGEDWINSHTQNEIDSKGMEIYNDLEIDFPSCLADFEARLEIV